MAMKEQQAAVNSSIMQAMRSAAGTPVPTAHLDYQAQQASILQLLQQGQLNQAFQQVRVLLPDAPSWAWAVYCKMYTGVFGEKNTGGFFITVNYFRSFSLKCNICSYFLS